jgi:hypothetical protein
MPTGPVRLMTMTSSLPCSRLKHNWMDIGLFSRSHGLAEILSSGVQALREAEPSSTCLSGL